MTDENREPTDLELLIEYYGMLNRQGPGSPDVTRKALSFIEGLTDDARIADIGCGSGGQTMVLGHAVPGRITGVDLFEKFIALFNENARKETLSDRVRGIVGSMDALPFADEELDLIWSEGAIYNIGFQKGLAEWKRFLKPGGYLAVTEVTWFTDERPAEINDFWQKEYPQIDTLPGKIAQVQSAGYVPVAAFTLPETCWTEHYYAPQIEAMRLFAEKYAGNQAAEDFIAAQEQEAELYHKYKNYYGYAFYIGRKPDV